VGDHQIARRAYVVETDGKPLELVVEVAPQIEEDLLPERRVSGECAMS
jgi:hypothetical protein